MTMSLLRTLFIVAAFFCLSFLAGCTPPQKELLTVDFQKDSTLRYKFVSSRDIVIDWGQMQKGDKKEKGREQRSSESLEMVVAYEPVEVAPYGLTTIKATFESVKVIRRAVQKGRSASARDAVESLSGKSFTFTISPSGKIEDYSQLKELIQETAENAFRSKGGRGRIKNPDMVSDFIATQWFLWDAVASVRNPVEGVAVGQTWNSKLWVPLPMVLRKARDVTYKLKEVRDTEKGKIAVITSSYSPAESLLPEWPQPYSGSFRMSGMFGFLGNYKLIDLHGDGEELFNIDKGRTEQYEQNFDIKLKASMTLPLGPNPDINIKHKLTMKLLEEK